MSVGNVVVSQEAPAKNHLWIQPKGAARFWNGSVWKMISGGGGGGGGDDYYTKAQADERFYLNSNINGVSGYAAKFTGQNALTYANDYIRIGDGIIYWDSVSGGFHIYHSDLLTNPSSTSKAGVYADWVSALGANSSGGGGGGMDETALWQELTDDPQWTLGDDKIININHLPNNINADTVDGYHANSFAFANGTNATGTWGISISGNATSATTATYDSGGNTISSTYLPLSGGTMTGTLNTQDLLPKTANTYNLGNENFPYTYGIINILYGGTNNNTWIRSNAVSGASLGIVFGYGGKTASTTLGKWTYTGLGIGTDSPGYKLDVSGTANITGNTTVGGCLGLTQTAGSGNGISLYGGATANPSYGLMFATTANYGTFGDLTGKYATYFTMDTTYGSKRGWAFRIKNTSTIVASLSTDGNFCAKGGVTALATSSSDKRLKKEIKPFNAKQIIDKLKPVEFEWNKKANKYNSNLELNKKNYGLIAQDSDGIIDNLVFDLPDGKGYKGVRYEKLIPILLQAVKEQQKEIDELKQIIKKLKV